MSAPRNQMRWLVRGIALAVLAIGWLFIAIANKFHVTPPVVFVGLGYLAIVATVYNLWRTGAAAVAPENEGEEAWDRPAGERGELEKEKRTLLKAIKEAEFDLEMGKLSKADAADLIQMYRTRAIEVIKELDRLDAGQAGSVRERIDREVKARIELMEREAPAKKTKQDKKASGADAKAAQAEPADAKAAQSAEVAPNEPEDAKEVSP